MKNPRRFFHLISYLQYPFVLVSLYFYALFMVSIVEKEVDWDHLNYVLLLYGISLSFSTLQDTTKTQNKLSRKVWESPRKGKVALTLIALMAFSFIAVGLFAFYFSPNALLESIAMGITVLGIGVIGMLKAAIEMFENHRLDKAENREKG